MTGTNFTRQRTRSSWNVELVNHQVLEAIEKENRAKNRKKGKSADKKQQTAVNIGEVAWDKMFAEGSFDLPPTRFIEKVRGSNRSRFSAYQERNPQHSQG